MVFTSYIFVFYFLPLALAVGLGRMFGFEFMKN